MRFHTEDRVIVKSLSKRPQTWNPDGGMDKWMGKVVTIKSSLGPSLGIEVDSYLIKEDEEDNSGFGWGWTENDLLPIPKPGDRVKLRTWEDMEKQYGLDSGGDISFLPFGHYVSKRVKEYCGNVVLVQKTNESSVEVKTNYDMLYNFAFSAIEEV